MKKINNHILLIMVLIISTPVLAQQGPATMLTAPEGSYTKYFKYFSTSAMGMPKNAAESAKGVFATETARYLVIDNVNSGSGFPIRTSRTDGKVCLLTAGHVIAALKNAPRTGDKISLDLYSNYLGRNNNGRAVTISGTNTGIPGATLAAYNYSNIEIDGQTLTLDYAILLIDKKLLPTKTIKALGYDVNTVPATNQHIYTLGHSNSMPMCIADSLSYVVGNSAVTRYSHSGNNGIGAGASGSPVFRERTTKTSDPVIGLNTAIPGEIEYVPDNELIGRDSYISYGDGSIMLRLSYISNQIQTHCRQAAAQSTSTDDPYLEPQDIDNTVNWNAFQVNVTANNLSGLGTASSTEYANENPGSKLVRAKKLTLNFDYQASAASQNQVTYILAAETALESGFSVTPAGNSEFSVYSIVSEPATTASRTATAGSSGAAAVPPLQAAVIYPNPSSNGIFTLEVPRGALSADRDYIIQVFSLDGKLVYQSSASTTAPNMLNIHDQQRGHYKVILKDDIGKVLWSKSIVY